MRDVGLILYDDDARFCVMTQATFNDLPEYSTSIPTGKTIGKRWKARHPEGWMLRGYEECDPPETDRILVPIWWISLVDAAMP